jgi:hypothetical protein
MIFNALIYITLTTFTIAFSLDLIATIRQAWHDSTATAATDATTVATVATATTATTVATATAAPLLPDPWLLDPDRYAPITRIAPTWVSTRPMLLLPSAKPSATPKPRDYNEVLTVAQLRKKATAAGIKYAGRLKKNQLLTLLAEVA